MGFRRWVAVLVVPVLWGCGGSDSSDGVPVACVESSAAIERALAAAPDEVTLGDGTRLSQCVAQASSDADLQTFGGLATAVAERLEQRAAADTAAALQLGYLVGATRRGARTTNGVMLELVRRIERSADVPGLQPPAEAALLRGVRAGEERG